MRFAVSLCFLIAVFALPSPSQVAEVSVSARRSQISGNQLGSFGFAQQPVRLDSGFGLAARLDIHSGRYLAHELSYGSLPYDRIKLPYRTSHWKILNK
jgi:hypothetical protein